MCLLVCLYGTHLLVSSLIQRDGRAGGNWGDWVILASCKHYFIRLHENLEQHPSNDIDYFIPSLFKPSLLHLCFKFLLHLIVVVRKVLD